jgi:hypothetical protein
MYTKELLETISKNVSNELTHYKFNKNTLIVSDKYRKGRVAALEYTLELIYFFMQQDKQIKEQFHHTLLLQLQETQMLRDGEYQKGLHDALQSIIMQINEK